MAALLNAFVSRFAAPYQKLVASRLRVYGLCVDDLLVEKAAVKKAITRCDANTRVERERRIARAFDLSAKRKALAPEVAASYEPINLYLRDILKATEEEIEEKTIIRG